MRLSRSAIAALLYWFSAGALAQEPRSMPASPMEKGCAPDGVPWPGLDKLPAFREPLAHPLIGQVYDARSPNAGIDGCPGRPLEKLAWVLRSAIKDSASSEGGPHIVVLGEVHDNPTHHALRAELLRSMLGNGQENAVTAPAMAAVFEHIRDDQQKAADEVVSATASVPLAEAVDRLFKALSWTTSGWPDEKIYTPLFSAVVAAHIRIVAGDATQADIGRVASGGLNALPKVEADSWAGVPSLSPALQDALLTELEASHCGILPKSRFGNMAFAQRYRDRHMANALSAASGAAGSAILFAGNGHARKDRGVPSFFGPGGLKGSAISVMLIEVEEGRNDPQDYIPRDPDGAAAADFIVFTPRTEREDPCIEMRRQFGKRAGG